MSEKWSTPLDRVKKVVLTSSCAAVADQGIPGKVFTEADFNTTDNKTVQPPLLTETHTIHLGYR